MRALGTIRERYQWYTGRASDGVRNSAIAGLAAAWLFSGSSEGDLSRLSTAPDGLLTAGALFAATLALDIAHYVAGGFVMGALAKWAEGRERAEGRVATDETMVHVDPWLPRIPRAFYFCKVLALCAGYVFLAAVLARAASA